MNKKKMLTFPNAKINLGLRVIEKRSDGFHNIETIFIPVPMCDMLEIIPTSSTSRFSVSGLTLDGNTKDNLCMKAFALFQDEVGCPNVAIHLHKVIPSGAGLGGGSSDAAFTLKLLASMFSPTLSHRKLVDMAGRIGSDCAFFIDNTTSLATSRGEVLQPINLNLDNLFLVLINPRMHVNTSQAYAGISPQKTTNNLSKLVLEPIETWQKTITNDFEETVFQIHPAIGKIKEEMLSHGATYSAMTGSGSTVFGLFRQEPPKLESHFPTYDIYRYIL
ncbi:MAG TPA: 4-(cytidine 5'-diphospho)-2-C-methyl-D-erythritol kinase [Williamwhitmania sp.]|nr:4-(cytidine 5'-diphospho)-2-C-methyl-D-erythritol kinase [Williamwhitmania sp.]